MASKNYLAQINIAMVGALDTVPTGYVGLSAKSDGLYMKRPSWGDLKILVHTDIGVTVAAIDHTHSYDNYVSWDVSFEGGSASQIYKTGNVSSYKGVNFIGQGGLTIAGSSNINGFLNVVITAPESGYTHPVYTAYNPTLSGALVLASLTTNTIGSVTALTTRTLTLANLGYTGATNANYYTHPVYTAQNDTLSGAIVLATLVTDATGHVTDTTTRTLTLANLGYTGNTNATYFTGHTVYINGVSQFTIGSGGYINVMPNNAAGDPVVTLTTIPASYRYDISVSGIPNCTLTGYTSGSTGTVAATDTINVAFSKLQYQVSNVSGSLSGGSATKLMIWASATTATYNSYLYYTSATQTLYSTVANFSSMVTSGRINAYAPANTSASALYLSRSLDTATYYDFISFSGTSAADKTKNISTMAIGSFIYAGMIRVVVAGTTRWIPYYT